MAAATYDAADHKAVITFTESTDEALDHYELRGVRGPCLAASFKVDVVLTAGNVAGREAVTIERPA